MDRGAFTIYRHRERPIRQERLNDLDQVGLEVRPEELVHYGVLPHRVLGLFYVEEDHAS